MKKYAFQSLLASFMVSMVSGVASADEVKEIAVLKGPACAVQSLSLSADGSRLVSVDSGIVWNVDERPTGREIYERNNSVNSGIVWNVDEQRQLSVLKARVKAMLDLAWMSADGQKAFGLIGGTFRVWDAGTGKELFATPRLSFGNYTAVALSPDGAYLAFAANEGLRPPVHGDGEKTAQNRAGASGRGFDPRPPGNVPPARQYSGGQITVWDLTAQKVKWKIPGVVEALTKTTPYQTPLLTGQQQRFGPNRTPLLKDQVDWLAFAPDGRRLAAMAETGAMFADETLPVRGPIGPIDSDRLFQGQNFPLAGKKLRVFRLEPNEEEPTAIVSAASPGPGHFIWLSDGKSLALRNDRRISLGDPQTGKFDEAFTLNYPRGPKDPQTGRFDETVIQTDPFHPTIIPSGWKEHQITLSADGSRLAAQLIREHVKEKVRNNCIVIWDVASRSLIGVFHLPDDTYKSQRQNPFPGSEVSPIPLETGDGSDLRIALSGDGKRLAAADAAGVVRVYNVAEIVAKTQIDSPLRRR